MKSTKSLKYLCYVLIALSCPLVMAIYHANGMVCTHVVRYEVIAAILATCSAILALPAGMNAFPISRLGTVALHEVESMICDCKQGCNRKCHPPPGVCISVDAGG